MDESGVWWTMDTCICVAESLCCPPETITTLLVSYTPIWYKTLKKIELLSSNNHTKKFILESSLAVQWLGLRAFTVGPCILSRFGHVRLFATLWTVALQALLSIGFSRKEYWSGMPCPFSGDLPNPGIEPMSPVAPELQTDSLPLNHWGSPTCWAWVQFLVGELRPYKLPSLAPPYKHLC